MLCGFELEHPVSFFIWPCHYGGRVDFRLLVAAVAGAGASGAGVRQTVGQVIACKVLKQGVSVLVKRRGLHVRHAHAMARA